MQHDAATLVIAKLEADKANFKAELEAELTGVRAALEAARGEAAVEAGASSSLTHVVPN